MEKFNQIYVENLKNNIENFYKSFYINKIIKGSILGIALLVVLFLVINFFVYYGNIGSNIRFILFYFLVGSFFITIYYFIIIPILELFKLKKGISFTLASQYIGAFYPEISDKLLNTIEFIERKESNVLAVAAIQQRSKGFSDFDFRNAVEPIKRKRFGFIFIFPLVVLLLVNGLNTNIITKGSQRLINYNEEVVKEAPFRFNVLTGDVFVNVGDNVVLRVGLEGEELPSEVFLEINEKVYRTNFSNGFFEFDVQDVNSNSRYRFKSGEFYSDFFEITAIKVPDLIELKLEVIYPKYLKKSNIEISNFTDVDIPFGSILNWRIISDNSSSIELRMNEIVQELKVIDKNNFFLTHTVDTNIDVNIQLFDIFQNNHDTEARKINCILDLYPTISYEISSDSLDNRFTYFSGRISDDYGFTKILASINNNDSSWYEHVVFSSLGGEGIFDFKFDHGKMVGETSVEFIVWDNDALNGFKSSKSSLFRLNILSDSEIKEVSKENGKKLLKELENLSKESKLLDQELKKFQEELVSEKKMDWNKQNSASELMKKFQELQKKKQILEQELNKNFNDLNSKNSEIIEKQKQFDELFKKVLDENSLELFKELEKLLEDLNKQEIQKHLEKMDLNQEDISKELDRNLEILKQLELETGLEDVIKNLEELEKDQNELINQTLLDDSIVEKQMEISQEFDKIKKDLDNLDSLNKTLNEPNELDLNSNLQDSISQNQKDAEEKLKSGKKNEAKDNQQKASEQIKKLKEEIEDSFDSGSSDQEGEDLESMRKLLENLLVISFDQEKVLMETKKLKGVDPSVVAISVRQKELINSSEMVKDSLYALSVRVPQIDALVSKETKVITSSMNDAVSSLEERNLNSASYKQQVSLTSINNLAVLIDEIIQQMQEQQKNNKKGTGSCSKPGEGSPKPSLKSSKKKQEELAKKMKQMKKNLEKGNSPGKMNPGSMGEGMSKEVAKMAAEQEMIRNEIREMMEELQKEGNLGGANSLKELEKLMEQNESDIINLKLDNEFITRQQEIQSKLLKAENAKREREFDKTRKSNEAPNISRNENLVLDEYLKKQSKELELLRLFNPNLNTYYKNRVLDYNSSPK